MLATSVSSECLREDLEAEFLAAVAKANLVKSAYSTKQRLRLYSYYKQACLGDAPAAAPPAHLVVERTKHASWTRRRGLSKDEARRRYVVALNEITGGATPAYTIHSAPQATAHCSKGR